MFPRLRVEVLSLVTTLAVVFGSAHAASASWMTIKNETGKTITVQETVVVNGQVKRGKTINLLAGETLREFLPNPTVKRLEVFDPQNPHEAAWSGNVNCKDETQIFAVTMSGGKVTLARVAAPVKK